MIKTELEWDYVDNWRPSIYRHIPTGRFYYLIKEDDKFFICGEGTETPEEAFEQLQLYVESGNNEEDE